MRFARSFGLSLLFGLASLGEVAHAKPGEHIRVGNAVITPSLSLGFQVRSNAFRAQSNPQVGGNFNVTPKISAVLDTPDVNFALTAAYTARKFVFLTNPEGFGDDARRAQVRALDRFNSFNAGVTLDGFRTRTVGVTVSDQFVVQNNPNDGVIDGDHPYVSQIRNALNGGIVVRPGPALSFGVKGRWTWTRFFIPNASSPRAAFNTRNSYGPQATVKWLFLPRTAWVLNAEYTYNNWADETPDNGQLAVETPDSHFIRADTGIQGRITERLKVILRVGYGGGLYKINRQTSAGGGLLGTVQLSYDISDSHTVMVGYRKSFFDSYFTNVTETNSLYARWNGKYGDRVTSSLKYGFRYENFRGGLERNDYLNQVNLNVDFMIFPWWHLGVAGSWVQRRSNDDLVEYDDVRGGLNLRFSY